MNEKTFTILAACFCVGSRAILQLLDRIIFGHKRLNFFSALFLNAFQPFVIALSISMILGHCDIELSRLFFEPCIIWSGLGAQLTAAAFSLGFREMTVRNVIISSKISDLFILGTTFLATRTFSLEAFIFSHLTTFAFLPLGYLVIRNGSLKFASTIFIILTLSFQAILNILFETHRFSSNLHEFLRFITCVMGWRTVFSIIPLLWGIAKLNDTPLSWRSISLFIWRGGLAYLSQAAFFFSILSNDNLIAWPILTTGPLVACWMARRFLKEEDESIETIVCLLLIIVFMFYFLTKRFL